MSSVNFEQGWIKIREYSLEDGLGRVRIGELRVQLDPAGRIFAVQVCVEGAVGFSADQSELIDLDFENIDDRAISWLEDKGLVLRDILPHRGLSRLFVAVAGTGSGGSVCLCLNGQGEQAEINEDAIKDMASIYDSTVFANPLLAIGRVILWAGNYGAEMRLASWIDDESLDWAFIPLAARRVQIGLGRGVQVRQGLPALSAKGMLVKTGSSDSRI